MANLFKTPISHFTKFPILPVAPLPLKKLKTFFLKNLHQKVKKKFFGEKFFFSIDLK